MHIEAIKLLKGSHDDTGKTGLGCFMNVIAYLNGEPQITDASPCVCVTVKPIAVWLNDYMDDAERQQMLPFILRAMGSATDDIHELVRRAELCADYAEKRAASAASAESAESAAWAARAESAARAAPFDYKAFRAELIADTLSLLDAMLPALIEPQAVHVERIEKLRSLVEV